jgi:hypothetical protein
VLHERAFGVVDIVSEAGL